MNWIAPYLNVVGLCAGFLGALITLFFGLPNIRVFNSGGYAEMEETDQIRRYRWISRTGVGLIASGFAFQLPAALSAIHY